MPSQLPLRRMRPLLGTFVEIGITEMSIRHNQNALAALELGFDRIAQLHQWLSFQQADSQLSELNAQPGRWVALAPEVLRVLALAKGISRASDHLFNCTVGGALIEAGVLPDHGSTWLACGDHTDLLVHSGRAKLCRPVRITLDGIAKGFAVDCAIATLKKHGTQSGWINAGGDIRAFGSVELPVLVRALDDNLRTAGRLRQGAWATSQSGRSLDLPGVILQKSAALKPQWAERQENFSVLARFAWRADALTKVAANAPPATRAQTVATLGGHLISVH